jgi:NEDD8-activating enzyme E1 regulatory subunit
MLDTRSIEDEFKALDLSAIDVEDEDSQQSPLIWYLLLRAVGAFVPVFNRYPGANPAAMESDAEWLVEKAKALAAGSDLANWITRAHADEMTRSCEVELHNIAALMGGVASQEAVKIITHQFLPLNHTYVFNGISGHAGTYAV